MESAPSDLTELGDLSNDRILEVVKKRYEKNEIYTSGGGHDILLSVNPFKDLPIYTNEYHKKYDWKTLTSKDDPHIFAITTKAYKRLRETEKNQVVLVTGESGSGKTENTKLMVKHLISICGSNSPDLAREIIEVNPLLEAFGNAKTVHNDNSSRFAKYLEIGFDDKFQITDATIRDYMLEKSRVVSHSEGEANFHVFYSFLAGLDENEKKDFKLDSANFGIAPKPYPKRKEELVRDFKQQLQVMQMIGLSEEEIGNVKAILASILHITNIKFNTAKNNAVEVKDEFPMIYGRYLYMTMERNNGSHQH
ncbi:unconventional myosin-Ia-like [Gigantopelta aegis]|uniref:unconventional myosin-Ia-like n=1 Tax=Gigantopelta aegis TaxID=1735272 RepID=UPI001B88C0EC|nr:unconventional myosin-Ia-like [Gigantopelta aegis]